MRKWNFFKWTRDNQKRFADEVAEELDSKMPANGGTITGPLIIDLPANSTSPEYPLIFKAKYNETSGQYTWKIGLSSVSPGLAIAYGNRQIIDIGASTGICPLDTNLTLGISKVPWGNVFTKKLNNGAENSGNIEIPSKGGTLALVSDIEDILRKHGLIPTEQTEQTKGEENAG